jgi:CRISPR-associated endonuclease Csn1
MKRVLGLDLGTNSIGWAVIDVPEDDESSGSVVAMGSRIFTMGAEEAGSALVTPAKERRQKRSMRRQIARRAKRRRRIREELTRIGLLPDDEREFDILMDADPHDLLRRSGEGNALTLREIGRVIYWFSSKRGFLSLRSEGADLTDDDDERAVRPRYRRPQVHADTGEIVSQGQEGILVDFLREQAVHHPDLITDQLIFGARGQLTYPVRPVKRDRFIGDGTWLDEFGIHGLVFFQRSIYWDEKTIGRCSIDPRRGGPRALRADRLAQKYRVWKTIVDLRVDFDERPLTADERAVAFDALMTQGTLAFTALRKRLRLPEGSPINFERSERTSLKGNETDAAMRKALGADHWKNLDEETRDRIVMLLLGDAQEEQIKATLTGEYSFDDDQIAGCLAARFPGGRAMYGRRTLRRLLEMLPEHDTERDALEAAGYRMPEEVRRERPVVVSELTNPLVRQTLSQLRKVLHAVAHTYGNDGDAPFDVVRIELSRDVRANRKDRERTNKFQRANEKANKEAGEFVEEFGQGAKANRDRKRRHRLWREQNEQCLYCGQPISATAVLSSATELDHILPRSRTLDDSLANMALVHADENREKGNRTITEWAGPDKAAEVAERLLHTSIPWAHKKPKLRRIEAVDVADAPVPEALIVQTGYINSVARDFVRQELGVEPEVSAGRITAQLRYRIGLPKDNEDHRRHALDAAMVSICDIRTARQLADRFRRERDYKVRRDDDYGSWEPWEGLRDDIRANYETINVSHAVKGKVSGQLHEETRYGKVTSPYSDEEHTWARRRLLSGGLTLPQLAEVADPAVRAALEANLRQRGIDPEVGVRKKLTFDSNAPPVMPDGKEIRRVRCHMELPGNRVLQPDAAPKTSVTMGRNHSAYVYENAKTGKWRIHVIPRFEAFQARGLPSDSMRDAHMGDGERFVFSVTIGTSLLLEIDGTDELFLVKSLDAANSRFDVQPAVASGVLKQVWHSGTKLKRLNARKVVVLPSGEVRTAGD